jgi:hypothetical protein
MIKPRRMGWLGHIAHAVQMTNVYKILDEKREGKDNSEDLGIDGRY